MSNFSIDGLISGFNTTDLINSILDIQVRGPETQIKRRIETETKKLTSLQALDANALSFGISVQGLKTPNLFNGKKATSSDSTVVNVSANSSAALGTYTLAPQNLALADQISSDYFSNTAENLNLVGKFILNGKTLSLGSGDTLNSLATQINGANAGVRASVIQTASSQYKLVMSATATGVNKIEMRNVGAGSVLSSLGLLSSDVSYDYTVNADTQGALGSLHNSTDTFGVEGNTFSITDAGGQKSITVRLTGPRTLSELAQDINNEASAQSADIKASVVTENNQQRLRIASSTGIPTEFSDPDNVLFQAGIVSGVQSEAFSSSTQPIATLMNLGSVNPSTVKITNGDASTTLELTIDLSKDSISAIADKINTAAQNTAGSDISARVITEGGNSRLEISSVSGRPQFDYAPSSDADQIFRTLGIVDNNFQNYDQRGENAQFKFNGVTVNRSSNLVTDLVNGLSFALIKESSSPVTVSVTEDLSNVKASVQNFADSYNKLISYLDEQTAFDPKGKNNGVLFGVGIARQIQSNLAGLVGRNVSILPSQKLAELNNGKGVDLGSIQVTDRQGRSATIDLSAAQTIQDILDAINSNGKVSLQAEINQSGTGINITDKSKGSGAFKIEEVNGRSTASGLGIRLQVFSNQITGKPIFDGGSTNLSAIGISLASDGSMTFDSTKLQSLLDSGPNQVKNLLAASGVGIADLFGATMNYYTAATTGALDTETQGVQKKIDLFNEQIARYEARATALQDTLKKRFASLEVSLSKSQQLSQLLTQKLSSSSSSG